MVKIALVTRESAAARQGVRAGDILESINGHSIRDVLDYRFYLTDTHVTLALLRDGAPYTVTLRKGEYEDIGLEFETPLMDEKHSCRNACVFCFIDQLPEGMRKTLYFKDDDDRLSFLHGNYVTLTNLSDEDIQRILTMHISPVNVSVHTTNPALRVKMMKNKRAGDVLRYLRTMADAGIALCTQIVLCKGWNDGEELDRTMRDLAAYFPALRSCAIVPVGLTRHREGLTPLEAFSPEECARVIAQVDAFGKVQSGSFRRHTQGNNIKHLRWFLNRDSELYYLAFSKEGAKSVIVFEPSEEMVGYIKHYLPYGAHQEN